MHQPVTLKDVARLAGVSYQTVSKVIHQNIQVREETMKRIWSAIETLGYVPNQAARNLRRTQSTTIGYTWLQQEHQTVNPILEGFLQGMMSAASAEDYQIFCFPTTGKFEQDMTVYENLYRSKKIGGYVLSNIEENDPRVLYLHERHIPFVCFGNPHVTGTDYVEVDGKYGMEMVVSHLLQQGHQRIVLLGWEGTSRVGKEREAGYAAGLEPYRIPYDAELVIRGEGTVESGFKSVQGIIRRMEFSAIAALNDLMAIGAMHALRESGIEPGVDAAVCGFDDFPLTEQLRPSLTTVRQPAFAVGQMAVQFLINRINNSEAADQNMLLTPELIIRNSSNLPKGES